jgi:hypothetical protein
MNPEEKKILEDTYRLANENHRLLKKMRRGIFLSHLTRIIYWIILIVMALGLYYYIQPYVNSFIDIFVQISNVFGKMKSVGDSVPDLSGIKGSLENLK